MARSPIQHPPFDNRIYSLPSPVSGPHGTLSRGLMFWESAIPGYTFPATMRFLYNPSTVTADYYMAPDASVSASLLFPTAFNSTQLRVPLNQSVTWSLLFDRTYELWGSYNDNGTPKYKNFPDGNNPQVVGVLADIIQMQQFTGMLVSYAGTAVGPGQSPATNINGYQGILQLIPSYVFFGKFLEGPSLSYFGYVSEWDVTITHWTQFMVPMRCVINITFTMMPQEAQSGNTSKSNSPVKNPATGTTQAPGTTNAGGRG